MTNRAEFRPLIAAAILALAACGSSGATNNADAPDNASMGNEAAVPANEVAPAAARAATATPAAVSADYMVGKWSAVNEDCSVTIDFARDGTVATPIGTAKWTVAGDKLSFDYGDGSKPTVSTVKLIGPDRIEITHDSGTKETEKRC